MWQFAGRIWSRGSRHVARHPCGKRTVRCGVGDAQALQAGNLHRGRRCSHFLQPYAADGRGWRAEIGFQQFLAKSYGFEYLGTSVRTNRADAHLAHHLVQAFADGLDVVLLRCFVVHLYFIPLDQIVQYGKSHIGVDGTCPVAQQQGGVHDLTDFPAFDNQGGLYTFLYGNQMVVYGTYGQQ